MLKGLIGSVIAVGLSSSPIINKPIDNSLVLPSTQAVIYDDELYNITLNNNESLYTFNNLKQYVNNQDFYSTIFYTLTYSYNSTDLEFENLSPVLDGSYKYLNQAITIDDIEYECYFNDNNLGIFELYEDGNKIEGINEIFLNCSSTNYEEIKSLVELDIQANQPAENNMPSVSDLFGYITQGVNAFIGSLGQAFESVVALFWDSTATTPGPTFLGLLMLISIGAGLIFLAYNVIKKLVYRVRG